MHCCLQGDDWRFKSDCALASFERRRLDLTRDANPQKSPTRRLRLKHGRCKLDAECAGPGWLALFGRRGHWLTYSQLSVLFPVASEAIVTIM